MKVLIIGSKGFIGSHVTNYFSSQPSIICHGADVVADYVSSNYHRIDATNSDFSELFEQNQFDVCINCSGASSVPDSFKHPLRDFALNVSNVAKILESIRIHAPLCKFINLSSAAVYGNPVHLPVDENSECRPVSPYGFHKRMAEDLCYEYFYHYGIRVCSLRIFSAYGPGLQKQILWDVYNKSRASQRIELFGTGNESRDFIFITDIARAIRAVIDRGVFDAAVYNVASGEEVAVSDVAKQLLGALGFKGELSFSGEVRSGDPVHWRADISKLKATGFSTEVKLSEGIKEYVKWLREKE